MTRRGQIHQKLIKRATFNSITPAGKLHNFQGVATNELAIPALPEQTKFGIVWKISKFDFSNLIIIDFYFILQGQNKNNHNEFCKQSHINCGQNFQRTSPGSTKLLSKSNLTNSRTPIVKSFRVVTVINN